MMAEEHPLVGGNIIIAILQSISRSGSLWIEGQNFGRQESPIKPIGQSINTDPNDDQRQSVHLIIPF